MKTKQQTHLLTSKNLVGKTLSIKKGFAEVLLSPLPEMTVDEYGLLHGGFIFGLADYAAMLAVNEPNVVLGKADVKFLKPAITSENILARAKLIKIEKNKHLVDVDVYNEQNEKIFNGSFVCYVTIKHVLHNIT